ncbi:MAG: glycerol-3-phosphate dehydrogenase [Candidatus Berkiellales bacterium]
MKLDQDHLYDIVVIGGGVQGAGIAADAAGRGLSVLLCEQNDLASATSSASSKLIHGGLRYLENYNFGLVRESLKERDILIKTAPHLVSPLRFMVPFIQQRRPFWLLRFGIFVYDVLGYSRYFKRSQMVYFNPHDPTNPLKRSIRKGFAYSDATVDDARLTIVTALRAARAGGKILTHTECTQAKRLEEAWLVTLRDTLTDVSIQIKCKALINAAGPWVDEVNQNVLNLPSQYRTQLVKGSHIIVPKLYPKEEAYVLQHKDGRVIFIIPYFKQFTMIGTTDTSFKGKPQNAKIDPQEIEYLCDIVSDYFHHPLTPEQILHSWSGVRALVETSSSTLATIPREYKIELTTSEKNHLPLISIFGGKLTTYRNLAENVVNQLTPFFPRHGGPWTSKRPLPGGDLPDDSLPEFLEILSMDYDWLPAHLAMRYAHSYGTLTLVLLSGAQKIADLGQHFGHGLYEKELEYLIQKEWARTSEDILWRRTKLGLFMSADEKKILQEWFQSYFKDH